MKTSKQVKYVKSFSKGQITIPKVLRQRLGLGDEFWLKMFEEEGKIVAVPAEQSEPDGDFATKLKSLSGDWFDLGDYQHVREDIAKRLDKRE